MYFEFPHTFSQRNYWIADVRLALFFVLTFIDILAILTLKSAFIFLFIALINSTNVALSFKNATVVLQICVFAIASMFLKLYEKTTILVVLCNTPTSSAACS